MPHDSDTWKQCGSPTEFERLLKFWCHFSAYCPNPMSTGPYRTESRTVSLQLLIVEYEDK